MSEPEQLEQAEQIEYNEAAAPGPARQRPWTFDAEGRAFRLASEAYRIKLGYLSDPLLAVHSSLIEALPHQITAVYDEMLTRQPLRFLLADDPGAGKTIMAGLLIRELIARGDARRCLICAPGNLTEQWQDELKSKFQLDFPILSRAMIEAARANPFAENDRLIMRLDHVSRNEAIKSDLAQSDWDLVVCDEAHKMSATYYGNELRKTKRYQLGELLSQLTRHLLLMTATPHNGKDDDFDQFMKLLDADRFEGPNLEGARRSDVADLMRRMVKERLLTFDGRPLFPERRATTVNYDLSAEEMALYENVTEYVREEFNRIDDMEQGGKKNAIGFALTILQRRLASSPAAIYRSLRRRREKLETRLQEEQAHPSSPARAPELRSDANLINLFNLNAELNAALNAELNAELNEYLNEDLDEKLVEAPAREIAAIETELIDHATAAQTLSQLAAEIDSLRALERQAQRVLSLGQDSKWLQLLGLLQDSPAMQKADSAARKLVIFTEHRDTLDYLRDKLNTAIGRSGAVVSIHGGISRAQRRQVEADFRQDPDVWILVATDAAGEGINLQSAHLMVNYDLPWNPNRLEQRFGRIHRIGQKEVCHLWNLVAGQTREGAVYQRLLEKLARERDTLNGQVFDVLGELFRQKPLRQLMIEAVRFGDSQATRDKVATAIDQSTDLRRVREILRDDLLVSGLMDSGKVAGIRADMERAHARRLQPYFIKAFFTEAFQALGGALHEREKGRYAINNVPVSLRQHAQQQRLGAIGRKYPRVCFHKALIYQDKKPKADFICPGNALLDATISLTLQRQRDTLARGATLVDPKDPGAQPRVLFYLETGLESGLETGLESEPDSVDESTNESSNQSASATAAPATATSSAIIARELRFLEIDSAGKIHEAGRAPYLDYRPIAAHEKARIAPALAQDWLHGPSLQKRARDYARQQLSPRLLQRVRAQRNKRLDKVEAAVQARLTRAISYWDSRAIQLRAQEEARKAPQRQNKRRMTSRQARRRADELAKRLRQRLAQIKQERRIRARPPLLKGAALIIPIGMLNGMLPGDAPAARTAHDSRKSEKLAMDAVLATERALGNRPIDVSSRRGLGYDIESRAAADGALRFIEVKGRRKGARDITMTKNELFSAFNSREQFILALVEIEDEQAGAIRYVKGFAFQEPADYEVAVKVDIKPLLAASAPPS